MTVQPEHHFYKTHLLVNGRWVTDGHWWPPLDSPQKPAGVKRVATPKPVIQKAPSTAFTSVRDFEEEAKNLGVLTPEMRNKFKQYFSRTDIGPGMRNMQCQMLIKNAVKKLNPQSSGK